jgi:hypothetical protein
MADELLRAAEAFLSGPDTNQPARWFIGMLAVVIGWRIMPMMLLQVPVLNGEAIGIRLLRGIMAAGLGILFGIAAAMAIGTLARP